GRRWGGVLAETEGGPGAGLFFFVRPLGALPGGPPAYLKRHPHRRHKRKPRACRGFPRRYPEKTSRDQGALDAPILSQGTNQARRRKRPDPPSLRATGRRRGRNYLARRHTDSAFVPVEVAGFVYRSSSGVSKVMMRFCSPSMRFGYELPSMSVVRVLSPSLTVYVP